METSTCSIAVSPADSLHSRARLFSALSQAFPVTFKSYSRVPDRSCAGIIAFDGRAADFDAAIQERVPLLIAGSSTDRLASVIMSDSPELDGRLRGRAFDQDEGLGVDALKPRDGDMVLATTKAGPVWIRRFERGSPIDMLAAAPAELGSSELLRDHFRVGRCMALLPLIQFLRACCADCVWRPAPLRACFIIDDPNLHAMSYGFVRYPAMAAHAAKHNYHAAMATIPLDGWYVNRNAAGFFATHSDRLSLLVHGNNHCRSELALPRSEEESVRLAAHALQRIEALERRSGVRVARVMAAPHGKCSEQTAAALARLDFDALCHSRPFPWRKHPPGDTLLAGWEPAQWSSTGIPVIPRFHMKSPEAEYVLRAYLDHPLLLLGHHGDAANALADFERAAGIVNSLGYVEWKDMGEIAQSNYVSRQIGSRLAVRAYSNRIRVAVPNGVTEIAVEVPSFGQLSATGQFEIGQDMLSPAERNDGAWRTSFSVPVDQPEIQIRWRHNDRLDPAQVEAPPTPLSFLIRRFATEARDRFQPLFRS